MGSGKDVALANPNSRFNSDRSTVILREEDEDRMDKYENEEGLLAPSGAYGAEDEEADQIFASIDAKMAERRQKQKARAEAAARLKKRQTVDDSAQGVFADLKKDLAKVSMDEWANLPDSGDFRAKRVKKADDKERYTPLPDSIIVGGARQNSGVLADVQDEEEELQTADFAQIQEARERVLGSRIDQAIGSTSAIETVNSEDYLAGLGASQKASMQVGDVKRARLMLQSAVQTNPHSPQAWIAAVRLEEAALEMKEARELIKKACSACPDSESVWLEALRLLPKDQSLDIMARALENVPASSKLWSKAAQIEDDPLKKRKLLQRGLEKNPNSAELWKNLVELEENEEEAKAILAVAVENCPNEVDLWMALARLEDHEGARKVINRARLANPKNAEIWLAAARLEEAYENVGLVDKIVQRAYDDLQLEPQQWLELAIQCESTGDVHTAKSIVKIACSSSDDVMVKVAEDSSAFTVAKALLESVEKDPSVWLHMVRLEKKSGGDIESTLSDAVSAHPESEELWLAYLHHKLDQKEYQAANEILNRAYEAIPTSEVIWLAAVKLYRSQGNTEEAQKLLALALEKIGHLSEQIWLLSARYASSPEEAKRVLINGLKYFSKSAGLWILLARLEANSNPLAARGVLEQAMAACPSSSGVWIAAAAFEEAQDPKNSFALSRARVLLEKGRASCSKSEELWLASVQLEFRAEQPTMAKSLLAKGLQMCPKSGLLWSEAIMRESRPLRKGKANVALAQVGQDPLVFLTMAKLFWADRKMEEAKDYLERAVVMDPSNGDLWAWYCLFTRQQSNETCESVVVKAVENNLTNGQFWKPFREDREDQFELDPRSVFVAYTESLQPPL